MRSKLEQLADMCQVRDTLDIFPHDASYYGSTGSYGSFTVYSVNGLHNETRIRDIIKKEAIFDDDFKASVCLKRATRTKFTETGCYAASSNSIN